MVSRYEVHPMEQAFRDWDAKDKIFQRELNIHICRKWDELTTEGKHGHYETLLSVCRSAISFWRNRAETESQASADSIREGIQAKQECANLRATNAELLAALKKSVQHCEQLASMVNTISVHAGLGRKVHERDYTEHALNAIVKASEA